MTYEDVFNVSPPIELALAVLNRRGRCLERMGRSISNLVVRSRCVDGKDVTTFYR